MPSPTKPSIWPLIKEMFLNQQEVTDYIRRHKLTSFLMASVLVLFALVLFATEQSIQQQDKNMVLQGKLNTLVHDAKYAPSCTTETLSLSEDYRRVNRQLERCQAISAGAPTPKRKPPREPIAALVPRHTTDDESSLKRKLDAIR